MSAGANVLLVGGDAGLAKSLGEAVKGEPGFGLAVHAAGVESPVDPRLLARAGIVVVDLDAARRDHLVALQSMMMQATGQTFIVVLAEPCSDAVQRWFLQIRVRDFLRKPVSGADVLAACSRIIRGQLEPPTDHTQVTCFLPAAGGVGNTTLAIEAAMQILGNASDKSSVALVDLDLHNDACADYLDLEPRLDFAEIGENGERLDAQLLEAMTTRHAGGLALIAAPSAAGQLRQMNRATILRLLDTVAARFENVVIDMPRMWSAWTDDILLGADRSFIVTDMTVPGLRFARRLTDQVNARLGMKNPARVIVNRFEQRFMFGSGLRRGDVAQALGGAFAEAIPNNYQLVREAIDQGVPLETLKPGNNVSTALKRLILARPQEERRAS